MKILSLASPPEWESKPQPSRLQSLACANALRLYIEHRIFLKCLIQIKSTQSTYIDAVNLHSGELNHEVHVVGTPLLFLVYHFYFTKREPVQPVYLKLVSLIRLFE